MSMNSPSRDCRFDNLKGILIFLVVLGHALPRLQNESMMISRYITGVIFAFHMPAFVFISGYFSKRVHPFERYSVKNVKSLLIPFAMAHVLMWLLDSRSISSLFYPGWTLWYLLSLFFWKTMLVPLAGIRCILAISIAVSLCAGFSPADRLLTLSRTLGFLPYFLAGYQTTPEAVDRLRKIHKAVPALILLVLFSAVVLMKMHHVPVNDAFQMADPYSAIEGISGLQGMLLRAFALCCGFVSTACLLILVSPKHSVLSDLGRHSMTVYLGHSFCLIAGAILLSSAFPALLANEAAVIILSVVLSVMICVFFGNRWMASWYQKGLDRIAALVLTGGKQSPGLSE